MTSTLYHNGVVHTAADPFAEAILVDDGVVTWVGAQDTATGLAARADEVVDLDGALVTPGFVDAHVHTLATGLALEAVDLSAATSPQDAADRLAAAARALDATDPGGTRVLLATGHDDTRASALDPAVLDAVTGGRPTVVTRPDGRAALVSSSFAARTGLDRTPGRDGSGVVDGDTAAAALEGVHRLDPALRGRAYRAALSRAAAHGIVAVHEMSAPATDTRAGLGELMSLAADATDPTPHVVAYRGELVSTGDEARALLAELPFLTGIGGDLAVDGSLADRTAALRSPYADLDPYRPAPAGPAGALRLDAEQIAAHLLACADAGTQGALRVTGDRAMDELARGLEIGASRSGAGTLRAGHHRVEHAPFVDAATLAALLLHGVAVSIQPAGESTWGGTDGLYAARLGGPRAANLSPFADLAGAGVPLAFGSGSPVTPLDPWQAVRAAIGHAEAAQRISARSAFRAHSRGGWRLAGLDHTGAGELRVGAPAHLAVWRAEHLAVQSAPGRLSQWNPEARAGQPLLPDLGEGLPDPQCLRTVRDGVVLFDALA